MSQKVDGIGPILSSDSDYHSIQDFGTQEIKIDKLLEQKVSNLSKQDNALNIQKWR